MPVTMSFMKMNSLLQQSLILETCFAATSQSLHYLEYLSQLYLSYLLWKHKVQSISLLHFFFFFFLLQSTRLVNLHHVACTFIHVSPLSRNILVNLLSRSNPQPQPKLLINTGIQQLSKTFEHRIKKFHNPISR